MTSPVVYQRAFEGNSCVTMQRPDQGRSYLTKTHPTRPDTQTSVILIFPEHEQHNVAVKTVCTLFVLNLHLYEVVAALLFSCLFL